MSVLEGVDCKKKAWLTSIHGSHNFNADKDISRIFQGQIIVYKD